MDSTTTVEPKSLSNLIRESFGDDNAKQEIRVNIDKKQICSKELAPLHPAEKPNNERDRNTGCHRGARREYAQHYNWNPYCRAYSDPALGITHQKTDMCRLHQQRTYERVALLADPAQPMTVAAGVFPRDQAEIAGHLLPAGKARYRLQSCCAPFSRALVASATKSTREKEPE